MFVCCFLLLLACLNVDLECFFFLLSLPPVVDQGLEMKSKVVDTGISARVVQKRDGILSLVRGCLDNQSDKAPYCLLEVPYYLLL